MGSGLVVAWPRAGLHCLMQSETEADTRFCFWLWLDFAYSGYIRQGNGSDSGSGGVSLIRVANDKRDLLLVLAWIPLLGLCSIRGLGTRASTTLQVVVLVWVHLLRQPHISEPPIPWVKFCFCNEGGQSKQTRNCTAGQDLNIF